jgi:hypothetical protein
VDIFISSLGSYGTSFFTLGGNVSGQGVSAVAVQQNLEQIVQNYYNFYKLATADGPGNYKNSRIKPVRRHHLINGDNIVHNGIMLNEKFYNVVTLDNDTLKINGAIAPAHQRVLNADGMIVSPENIHDWPQATSAYQQTFLHEEVAKMYRGEIVLLGNPEIEPFDVLALSDPSMGLTGNVEVDSVIHSFNQETGYITIVRPRAIVIINDSLMASLGSAVMDFLGQASNIVYGYAASVINTPRDTAGTAGAVITAGSAGFIGGEVAGTAISAAGGIATIAATGEAYAAGTLAASAAVALAPWVAGAAVLGGAGLVFWLGSQLQKANPIGVIPLMRFERPWVAGLEGFRTDDLKQLIIDKWQYFKEDEIDNSLYSYRVAKGMGLI